MNDPTPHLVPVSEAKGKLSELVRAADDENVIIMTYGRPAAILVSARRYGDLIEHIEDLEDRLSVYEREHLTMSLDKVVAELGLDDD
ncbi:type II toxin-antitoxin system prevent-host-death family antitoxin [Gordonia sp. ABSL1-1]|uniref:type II toxin-antitoxin system prevent-host-death family antitoxin n=1 Tax=Gordonia sp. ABSL1-1 TaxID=3053923 RepID=UPI0025731ED4|nr:type II toxin-antitoxin system prevent-host-death family antitoxin [Gordonia sp. ABSL1-1]MDL9938666.1 type II toxin-antitoxin system prevent-host-death family antitoxin [Gordonia sp. ABSL1-1]